MMIWLTMLSMMVIIFTSRYLFLEPRLPIKLSPAFRQFLRYSAPAVLTAIWAPLVFVGDNGLRLEWQNSYLWAGLLAAILAWRGVDTLWTVLISLLLFVLLQHGLWG